MVSSYYLSCHLYRFVSFSIRGFWPDAGEYVNKIIIPDAAIKQYNNKHGHVVAKLIKSATIKQPVRAPVIDEDALYLQYNLNQE
jgi:hypothetical protein